MEEKILGGLETDAEKIAQFEREKILQQKEKEFNQLLPYYKANDRFKSVSHGQWGDKTPLEAALEQAIKDGNIPLAEKISNRISLEEHLKNLEEAQQGKALKEQLGEQEKLKKKKKDVHLHWGFESKQRWESKGNM